MTTATSSLAQGSINFANNNATRVSLITATSGSTTFVPVGTQFLADLIFAPDGTAVDAFSSVAVRVGAPASFVSPGVFNGGGRTVVQLNPAGGFGLFQVRVWDTTYGATYEEARLFTCNVGTSSILRVDTGDPTTTPPGTPASLVTAGLSSIMMWGAAAAPPGCPEPSTYALGVLGIAASWFCCRRKKRL
jgi:hypothetical protein